MTLYRKYATIFLITFFTTIAFGSIVNSMDDQPSRFSTAGYHRRPFAAAAYAAHNRQLAFQLKMVIAMSEMIRSGKTVPIYVWYN